MRRKIQVFHPVNQELFAFLLLVGLVSFSGMLITLFGSSIATAPTYKVVLVLFISIPALLILFLGRRGIDIGVFGWILTLGLGYRTLALTPLLSIHPAEILIWGMAVVQLVLNLMSRYSHERIWVPAWLIPLLLFLVWGCFLAFISGYRWDAVLSEMKNFLVLFPIYLVINLFLRSPRRWRWLVLTFFLVGTWVAALGITEYMFPDLTTPFAAYFGSTSTSQLASDFGFVRATFSFWGSPDAVFILVLALPLAIAIWQWWKMFFVNGLVLVASLLMLVGIYISGHRDAWLMSGAILLLWLIIERKWLLVFLSMIMVPFFYTLLPQSARDRLNSVSLLVQGKAVDSSGVERWSRMIGALAKIQMRPWGWGWTAAGWVHSDFLQISVNLEILAGLFFIAVYLIILFDLGHQIHSPFRERDLAVLAVPLFLSFFVVGAIFLMEAMIVLPQLVLPLWFIWVLSDIWRRRASTGVA